MSSNKLPQSMVRLAQEIREHQKNSESLQRIQKEYLQFQLQVLSASLNNLAKELEKELKKDQPKQ